MVDLQLGGIGPTKEEFINTLQNPVWPFISIKIKKTTKPVKDTQIELNVGPALYESWMKNNGSDLHQLFFVPSGSPLKSWTHDMSVTFEIMEKLGLMNKMETWIRNARINISDVLLRKTPDIKLKHNAQAIKTCQELLKACKLFEQISKTELLLIIAKDAIRKKNRDSDTMIYRLAMGIYHYIFIDMPVVNGLEEWDSGFLYFSQDKKINKEYPFMMEKITKVKSKPEQDTFKTVLAFIIGCYLYYRGVEELDG